MNDEAPRRHLVKAADLIIRISFVIRHSDFVI
jgi:hypothetical protein